MSDQRLCPRQQWVTRMLVLTMVQVQMVAATCRGSACEREMWARGRCGEAHAGRQHLWLTDTLLTPSPSYYSSTSRALANPTSDSHRPSSAFPMPITTLYTVHILYDPSRGQSPPVLISNILRSSHCSPYAPRRKVVCQILGWISSSSQFIRHTQMSSLIDFNVASVRETSGVT
jgi:hypothetical protein